MALWPGTGPVWIVGCGNMGGALLRRWLAAGLEPSRVTVIDPAPRRVDGVAWLTEPPEGSPSLMVLGIKPQLLDEAAALYGNSATGDTVIVSMLAGIEGQTLAHHFPAAGCIVRAMPNLPVALGKGVTGLFSTSGFNAAVDALFAPTGHVEWLADEELFHAVTALSGSGPAFVYRFIGALTDAASKLGLPADQALRLARSMVEGAAALSIAANEDPAELARQVTSPNGTTAAGLAELDRDGLFAARVEATLVAAAQRSKSLAAG